MRYEDDYLFEDEKRPARSGKASSAARKRPESAARKPSRQTSDAPRTKKPRPDGERPVKKRPVSEGGRERRPASARPVTDRDRQARRPSAQRPVKRRIDYDDEYRAPAKKRAPARGRRKAKSSGGMTFLWIAVALAIAFAISMFLHSNVFEVVRMSGDSMYATIKKGDVVLVDKMSKEDIQRGDLVAIKLAGESGYIIRRVVGLPSETVSIESGKTYIDGNAISERYIGLETYDSFDGVTLPTKKYYVLCDNRTDLSDSRATDISMVDISQIDGKVSFRIWPMARFGSLR